VPCGLCFCTLLFGAFAAEEGSAERWQLQCAQLRSDKAALSSSLRAKEVEAAAAAEAAAAEIRSVTEDAAAAMDENRRLTAEVQELRHQVSLEQQFRLLIRHATKGLASAALCFRKGSCPAGYCIRRFWLMTCCFYSF
jgi:hypothetical protein